MSGPEPARAQAGFTLLELLVTLAIVAGLVAVAPRLAAFGAGGVERAARVVAAELRMARTDALTHGRPARVAFDLDGRRVLRDGAKPAALPADVAMAAVTAEEAAVAPGRPAIVFFPEGGATGGRVTVRRGGDAREIEARWLTGAVHVR
jgi:general secretion pathway protein H